MILSENGGNWLRIGTKGGLDNETTPEYDNAAQKSGDLSYLCLNGVIEALKPRTWVEGLRNETC